MLGGTPIGRTLKKVFDEHFQKIGKAIGCSEYSKISPLDIIVLTDGVPCRLTPFSYLEIVDLTNLPLTADEPADVIAEAVKRLKDSHYHPNTMGIQFVQIGNETLAKQALKELAKGDNGVRYYYFGVSTGSYF